MQQGIGIPWNGARTGTGEHWAVIRLGLCWVQERKSQQTQIQVWSYRCSSPRSIHLHGVVLTESLLHYVRQSVLSAILLGHGRLPCCSYCFERDWPTCGGWSRSWWTFGSWTAMHGGWRPPAGRCGYGVARERFFKVLATIWQLVGHHQSISRRHWRMGRCPGRSRSNSLDPSAGGGALGIRDGHREIRFLGAFWARRSDTETSPDLSSMKPPASDDRMRHPCGPRGDGRSGGRET